MDAIAFDSDKVLLSTTAFHIRLTCEVDLYRMEKIRTPSGSTTQIIAMVGFAFSNTSQEMSWLMSLVVQSGTWTTYYNFLAPGSG